jgi:hypothetical protein
MTEEGATNADSIVIGDTPMGELNKALKHLSIGGKTMCAKDYVMRS